MTIRHYLAIADRLPDEANWSIVFPAFPGVTSVASSEAEVLPQARDALATVIEDLLADAEPLPQAIEDGGAQGFDAGQYHAPQTVLVDIDVPVPGMPKEIGGPKGPEPTRYGDWEQKGRCTDF